MLSFSTVQAATFTKAQFKADKTDANYNVALQKCDALSGDAKSGCVTSAKASYGKN